LRLAPQFRRGETPGSGRAAGEPEERHSANESRGRSNFDRAPLRCVLDRLSEGAARSRPPRSRGRETGRRDPASARDESSRAGGRPPREPAVPLDVRGNPSSSRRIASSFGSSDPLTRRLAVGSAPRASGDGEESTAGRVAFARPAVEGWSRGADRRRNRRSKRGSGNRSPATSAEIGPARSGAGNVGKVHEGMSRVAGCFNSRCTCESSDPGNPRAPAGKRPRRWGERQRPTSRERIGDGRKRRPPGRSSTAFPEGPFDDRCAQRGNPARATPRLSSWRSFPSVADIG
jgi:hypothetical protein